MPRPDLPEEQAQRLAAVKAATASARLAVLHTLFVLRGAAGQDPVRAAFVPMEAAFSTCPSGTQREMALNLLRVARHAAGRLMETGCTPTAAELAQVEAAIDAAASMAAEAATQQAQ